MERIFNKKITSPFEKTIARIENLTKKAAENGAKIVSFQEFTMTINEKDENRLVEQYKRIAKENNIYLSITYAYFAKEGKGENIHLFIDNNGEIQLDYTKRYLLGFGSFGENAVFKKGPEIIQSTDTPYGKIGISICRDMAFPSFMRQAARDNVDIMLSPSYDWPKSPVPWYLLSTIENGFSFVRPTYNGFTYAADYNGNVLAHMDSDETEDGIMYADVPTKGIKTLYPMIGDLLGWLCVLGFGVFVAMSIIGRVCKNHN
ncbi:MAG: carbon-nitrogen hydrolase family protein [Candidatus Sifarchaeia archaeon]